MPTLSLYEHIDFNARRGVVVPLRWNSGDARIVVAPARYPQATGGTRSVEMPLPLDRATRENLWQEAVTWVGGGAAPAPYIRAVAARSWYAVFSRRVLKNYQFTGVYWKRLLRSPGLQPFGSGEGRVRAANAMENLGRQQDRERRAPNFDAIRVSLNFGQAGSGSQDEQHAVACRFLDSIGDEIIDVESKLLQEHNLVTDADMQGFGRERLNNLLRSRFERIRRRSARQCGRADSVDLEAFVRMIEGESMLRERLLVAAAAALPTDTCTVYRAMNLAGPRTPSGSLVSVPVMLSPAMRSAVEFFGGVPSRPRSRGVPELLILADLLEILLGADPRRSDLISSFHKAIGFATYFPIWVNDKRKKDYTYTQSRRYGRSESMTDDVSESWWP